MPNITEKENIFVSAVIVSAGNSTRMGGVNKQFLEINNIPVVAHTISVFEKTESISEIVVVTRESDIEDVKITADTSILDLLVNLNFVASKGEAKRLIQGGGVKLDGEKISDLGFIVTPSLNKVLQAGKRKFARLV